MRGGMEDFSIWEELQKDEVDDFVDGMVLSKVCLPVMPVLHLGEVAAISPDPGTVDEHVLPVFKLNKVLLGG